VTKYVQEIASRLNRENDVTILTTDSYGNLPASEEVEGVKVMRFRSWAPDDSIYHSSGMFAYLLRNSGRYEVVHTNNYHALPSYYVAETKNRNKVVFTPHFHGTQGHSRLRSLLHIPYRILGGRIFAKSDKVIYCTQFEKNMILHSFRIPENKLCMIREGITPIKIRRESGQKDGNMILCVSRLEKYKGIQRILSALQSLPSFKLTVVGTGRYYETLLRLTRRLNLQDRVLFLQRVTDEMLQRIYSQADVAVLLSDHEQYSFFVGEALSAGIPCVVANRTALKEWVDDTTCLGVDDPDNSVLVSEVILRAVGRKVERIVPTWDDYARRLMRAYEEALLN